MLNIRTDRIHSGATLSNVPNVNTRYKSSGSSSASFFTHVRVNA
ncbi:hypothetical protein OIU78_008079 [Salix suchowensis]|uniref:Uncharacterized protein n=1 Tax=Salix purpurea TaxID=77065 RepID=A0A9Q0PPF7_SALPP|nr:hypothetical protein OIU78_008079 [Salix suchowensis]KAJ6691960.1 hypothetical protein OIU79_013853 [Salix purpurea]